MYKKRDEGTHGSRMRTSCKSNSGSRGHERDVDICLLLSLLSNNCLDKRPVGLEISTDLSDSTKRKEEVSVVPGE
jgi:hypothetical protein